MSQRQNEIVRSYLDTLPEEGNANDGSRTLESLAAELDVEAESLRQFRDGTDAAVSQSLVAAFAKQLGTGTSFIGDPTDPAVGHDPSSGWYGHMLRRAKDRNDAYDQYEVIDETRGEAASALDAWSDLMIHGSVGEDSRYRGGFEPAPHHETGKDRRDALDRIARNINTYLLPDPLKLTAAREMMKFGACYGEIGVDLVGGRWDMSALQQLSSREILPHRDANGKLDPEKAWMQIRRGESEPRHYFPVWSIAPFQNIVDWGSTEGRSIFWSGRRAWVQVEAMEASLIVRRLERASQRLKHVLDVGHLTDERAIKKAIAEYRAMHKRVRTVDGSRNFHVQRITPPSGEDVILAKRDKNSPADVTVLEGDPTIGEMGDFNHHWAKWLATLGPPKAHLGYEGDTMRSVVTDLHIVFARKVRRAQIRFIAGLNHMYWVGLMLRGIDPRSVRYVIYPPSLGTRDELVRAQIQLMHATTVKYLSDAFGATGKQPSVKWMLKYVMGMDNEVIDALEYEKIVVPKKGSASANKNPPKEATQMANAAMTNPAIIEQMDHLGWMLEERELSRRTGPIFKQYERQMLPAFTNAQIGEVCRSLGVTELRAA